MPTEMPFSRNMFSLTWIALGKKKKKRRKKKKLPKKKSPLDALRC
jgi:hypothetical protein